MKFRNKNILLISPEPWDHLFVSKHHYAMHLGALGNKVYFLGPPEQQYSINETNYPNIWRIGYKGFVKGLRFFPAWIQRWFIRKEFERLQSMAKVNFDIIWSFDNSVFYDFSALPRTVYCISHIVDLNQNFQTAKAAGTAHLCLGVIPSIVERLKQYNPNTHLIPHGVSLNVEETNRIELPGENSVKALYAGNLAMPFIDWSLLTNLVNAFPLVDFIFVGDHHEVVTDKFAQELPKNIHLVRRVSSEHLKSYLASADVLLLAYTPAYYQNYASPHKMMEYLASGKMIVATWTEEYAELHASGMVFMNAGDESFLIDFKKVVSSLGYYNRDGFQRTRMEFAQHYTYEKLLYKIEELINAS